MKLSFQRLFFILAFVFGLFAIMVLAKAVLIPLSLAMLISFILLPLVKKLEGWGVNKLLSALIPLLTLIIIIGGGITLFSAQIINLSAELEDFTGKIMSAFSDVIVFINENLNFMEDLNRDELIENGRAWLKESSGALIQNTFSGTAAFIAGLLSTIIFTFLLLIYRAGLTDAFVAFGDDSNKEKTFKMLKNIQNVGKKYLAGMILLIAILGVINSVGLLIIGIDSPWLFGFLAAILSIVPFVGTTIGAAIPALYALVSTGSLWMPVAIIILFWAVQIIESNFLSPKIVGRNLNVNALVTILSLLIGASVWGIAGMVLFLPFAAILKVICEEFYQLRPVAMLISSDISSGDEVESKIVTWFKKINVVSWFKKIKAWFTNK